jgi:arylsulfatase A-like enzyme
LALDGESLLPLLRGGQRLKRSSIFWHFPGYLDIPVIRGRDRDVQAGFRTRPVSVIRQGDWKLHLFHEEWQLDGGRQQLATNQAVELYDLVADPGERINVANANADKRDALLDELIEWLKATEAPIPDQPNPDLDPLHRVPDATATSRGANE